MIEITRYHVGKCDACGGNPADYNIRAPKELWASPLHPCQPCMINLVKNHPIIRDVLFLQAATRV